MRPRSNQGQFAKAVQLVRQVDKGYGRVTIATGFCFWHSCELCRLNDLLALLEA